MRIAVVGATGTIGRAVVEALASRHEVIPVSHKNSRITVDLALNACSRKAAGPGRRARSAP